MQRMTFEVQVKEIPEKQSLVPLTAAQSLLLILATFSQQVIYCKIQFQTLDSPIKIFKVPSTTNMYFQQLTDHIQHFAGCVDQNMHSDHRLLIPNIRQKHLGQNSIAYAIN